MKNLIKICIVLFCVNLFSQNDGYPRPDTGYFWGDNIRGLISKDLYQDNKNYTQDGYYTIRGYDIYLDIIDKNDLELGYQMKFSDGEFSKINRNWLDLRLGDKIWYYADSLWITEKPYLINHDIYLAQCGNNGKVRKIPLISSWEEKDDDKNKNTGFDSNWGQNLDLIKTAEVKKTPTNQNNYDFGLGQKTKPIRNYCVEGYIQKYPDLFDMYIAVNRLNEYSPFWSRGDDLSMFNVLPRKERQALKKCLTGMSGLRRALGIGGIVTGSTFLTTGAYFLVKSLINKSGSDPSYNFDHEQDR